MKTLMLITNNIWEFFPNRIGNELFEERKCLKSIESIRQLVSDRPSETFSRVSAEWYILNVGFDLERQILASEG